MTEPDLVPARSPMPESELSTAVTRNTGWLMLGNTVSKIFFLVAGVIAARYLGTEAYGIYSFATFLAFIFAVLADSGLQTILVREISRDNSKASRYFGCALLLKGMLTLLALLLLSCTIALMGLSPIQIQAVLVAMAAFLALSYGGTAVAIFRSLERMVFEAIVTAVQGMLFLLLVVVAITVRADILLFIVALLISYVVSTLLAFHWVLTRFARPQFRLDIGLAKHLLKEAWPVGLSFFLFVLYGRIGTVALEAMRTSAEVGAYSAAYNLVRNVNFVPMAFMAAMLPTLSQSAVSNPGRFSRVYTTSFKAMLLLGMPIAVGGMFLADPLIRIVYGPAFTEASAAFRIIAWSILFTFLSLVSRAALESANRQIYWTCALAIGVVANLLLNALLIPQSGIVGASLALLVTDILIFLVALYSVLRWIPELTWRLVKLGLTTLASAIVLGLTLVLLGGQHLVLATLAASLTYLSSLLLFRVVNKEDLALIRKAITPDQEKPTDLGGIDF